MAEFGPVLLANIKNEESHTLAGYEATGGRRPCLAHGPGQLSDERGITRHSAAHPLTRFGQVAGWHTVRWQ